MLRNILKIAAGVGTFFGLCAVIAAFYYSLATRRAERSLVAVVSGEGIEEAEDVAKILGQFHDDDARIKARCQVWKGGSLLSSFHFPDLTPGPAKLARGREIRLFTVGSQWQAKESWRQHRSPPC